MFEVLNHSRRVNLIKSYLQQPSKVSKSELDEVLKAFPFSVSEGEENLNFLAIKLFRALKESLDVPTLASKLTFSEEETREILNARAVEVCFPVSDGKTSLLLKALVIPYKGERAVALESISEKSLEVLKTLTGKSFLLTFSHGFDFGTNSFMLGVYSALMFGEKAQSFAFTGVLTPEGEIEGVKHLEKKLAGAKSQKVPLIFPSESMRSVEDLKEFIENLSIPVLILPKREGFGEEVFDGEFPFGREYLERVFHIEEGLFYIKPYNNDKEGFEEFARWLERLSAKLSELGERVNFKVALASKLVSMSFLAGVKFSKARLRVDFFRFENRERYVKAFYIESDKHTESAQELIEVQKPEGDTKEVFILTKSETAPSDALKIKLPSGEELDRNLLGVASAVNKLLRGTEFNCVPLKIEAPTGFAFALGYLLEDYKCLVITHYDGEKYVPVYTLGRESREPVYLLNAFSLNMLEKTPAHVEVEEIHPEGVFQLIKERDFISYISHQSTAQVLSEVLGREVKANRVNIKLPHGAQALVFQLKVRPPEGGIFGVEELKTIVEEGLYSFHLVKVFY